MGGWGKEESFSDYTVLYDWFAPRFSTIALLVAGPPTMVDEWSIYLRLLLQKSPTCEPLSIIDNVVPTY